MSVRTSAGKILSGRYGLNANGGHLSPPVYDAPTYQNAQGVRTITIVPTNLNGHDSLKITTSTGRSITLAATVNVPLIVDLARLYPNETPDPMLFKIAGMTAESASTASGVSLVITPISQVTAPVLAGVKVGDVWQITNPVWNIEPKTQTYVIQESDDGITSDTDLDPIVVTAFPDELYYRLKFTVEGPAGDSATSYSAWIGPMDPAPAAQTLYQLTTANIVMADSIYWPNTQTTWFKWVVPEWIDVPIGNVVEWTTTDPTNYPNDGPDIDWKPTEFFVGFGWVPVDDALATDPTTGRPANYSVWRTNPESNDRWKCRFRHWDPDDPANSDPDNPGLVSPISLPSWYVAEPDVALPDPTELVYRQLTIRSDAMLGVTPNAPELFSYGILGGDCLQWMTSGAYSSDGSKVCMCEDAGCFLMSLTSGRTWYRPHAIGMKVSQMQGIASDPNNTSRWFALGGSLAQPEKDATFSGLYVTTDDWANASLVKVVAGIGTCQWSVDTITCYPAAGGSTAKWYFAVNRGGNPNAAAFCKSGSDNGATWGSLASLAWDTYGRICKLQASPHTSGTLYLACNNGLFRSTNDGTTFAAAPGNWPTGVQIHWFWIDPLDAAHMYLTATTSDTTKQGLYETTNATAGSPTWTRIRACNANWAAVGALTGGARTIYVKCLATGGGTSTTTDTDNVRLRTGTWITRATAAPNQIAFSVLGAQSDLFPFGGMCWTDGSSSKLSFVVASPVDPDQFTMHGRTSNLRTTNQGLSVTLSCDGFGGAMWRGAWYGLVDKDRIACSLHDTGFGFSKNGGLSTRINAFDPVKAATQTVKGGATISSWTGRAVVQLPDSTAVSVAGWRGRVIGSLGTASSVGGVIIYSDKDSTTVNHLMGGSPTQGQSNAHGGGWGNRNKAGYLRHDPNKIWMGNNMVNLSSSTTWNESTNDIIGAAHDGTDLTYGCNGSTVYRSTNFGTSWSSLYAFSNLLFYLDGPTGGCSGYDGRRMFFQTSTRGISMLVDNSGTPAVTTFDLTTDIFDSPVPIDGIISDLASDPLDERYIFITTKAMGTTKRVFRGKFNAAFTSITWENITMNGPHGSRSIRLYDTGLNGCVHCAYEDMGTYIAPSPADWQPRVGWYGFAGQPSNNQTLVINGVTWTFKTSGATTAQTNIGASLTATLTQLATDLNASVNASLTSCTYTARYGTRLEVTADSPTRNAAFTFPLTAGTTSNATVYDNVTPYRDYVWNLCALPVSAS